MPRGRAGLLESGEPLSEAKKKVLFIQNFEKLSKHSKIKTLLKAAIVRYWLVRLAAVNWSATHWPGKRPNELLSQLAAIWQFTKRS